MASTVEWMVEQIKERSASLLEDSASDLFGLFGDDERALEAGLAQLESAARLVAPGLDARLLRARILANLGRELEATRALKAVAHERPRDPHVLAELASIAEDAGRAKEALELYRRAVEALRPAEPGAQYLVIGYVACLAHAGRVREALRLRRQWVQRLGKARKPRRALQRWTAGG